MAKISTSTIFSGKKHFIAARHRVSRKLIVAFFALMGFALNSQQANAIDFIWTGGAGDNLWTSSGNWSGSFGVLYPAYYIANDNISIPAGATVIYPANAVRGGSINNITTTGSGTVTLTLNQALPTNGTISVSGASLIINGTSLLSSATLTVAGSRTLTANTDLTVSGAINVNASSIITGSAGSDISGASLSTNGTFTLSPLGLFTISGLTNITNGVTTVSNTSLFSTGNLTIGSGTGFNLNKPMAITGGGTITANAAFTSIAGATVTSTGPINISSGVTFTAGAALSAGSITDNGNFTSSAAATINVSGAITMASGTNFTAGSTLSAGSFTTNSGNNVSLGGLATISGAATINESMAFTGTGSVSAGSLSIANSKTLTNNNPITVTNAITTNGQATFSGTGSLTGTGPFTAASAGTITFNKAVSVTGAANLNTSSTLTGGSTFTSGSFTSAGTLLLNTPVVANGNLAAASITSGATVSLTLNGTTNNVTGTFLVNTNTLTLDGTSTNTTINAFTINGSNQLTLNTPISITNAFTAGTGSTISGSVAAASMSAASLTASGGVTISNIAPITISGTTTFGGGTCTLGTSTALFQTANLIDNNQTIVLNRPLKVTSLITLNSSSGITGNANGTINTVDLTASASTNVSLQAAYTGTGTMTFSSNSHTFNNTGTTRTNNLILNAATLTMATALTVDNLISAIGGTSNFTNTGATGTKDLSITSSILYASTTLSCSGNITGVSGTNVFTNTSAVGAVNLITSAGSFQLGNVNSPAITMTLNISGATTSASGTTLTLASSATNSATTLNTGTLALAGGLTVLNSATINSAGTSNTITGAVNLNNSNYNLTFLGTGTTTLSGAVNLTVGGCALIIGNTSTSPNTTVNFASSSSVAASNTVSITNNAKVNFNGTSGSIITFTNQQLTLTNNGTLVATYVTMNNNNVSPIVNAATGTFTASNFTVAAAGGVNFSMTNNGAMTTNTTSITTSNTTNIINNSTGTWNSAGLTLNLNASGTGAPGIITNSGTFTASPLTMNVAAGASGITNSGTFTANATSLIWFKTGSVNNFISNTGTFNAGTSGSKCTIDVLGQSNYITNTGTSSQTATFNLGSTSVINIQGTVNGGVVNTNNAYSVFNLRSDANGSAAFGPITTGQNLQIQGSYNVERFFTGGLDAANRGYRLLSSPVSFTNSLNFASATYSTPNTNIISLANIKNGTYIGGPGGTGFSVVNANPSMYLYKETLAASTSTTNFLAGKHLGISNIYASTVDVVHSVTSNNVSGLSIPVGNGFLMYFVGKPNRTSGGSSAGPPEDATVTYPGYINQGSFTVNLWYTTTGGTAKLSNSSSLSVAARGFNMVGNPYPSTLDLSKLYNDNSSSIDVIYMLSSRTGGTSQDYVAYSTNGSSTPAINGYAVSGAGFIVHVKTSGSTTSTLTFNEAQKAATTQITGTSLIMSTPRTEVLAVDGKLGENSLSKAQQSIMAIPVQNTEQPITGLYVKMEKDANVFNYCGIYFRKDYAMKFEDGDAPYIGSNPVSLASQTSDGIATAINRLPDYHDGSRVWLNVNATATGVYNLKVEGIRNIDELYDIYLIDHYKKDSLDMRHNGAYNFNLITTDAATYGDKRFELVIRIRPLPQYLLTNFTGSKVTEGVNVNWKTVNESNYTGFTLEKLNKATSAYESIYDKQSDGSADYAYIDHMPTSGVNTYRLKQNDAYGRISYSEPVNIFYDKLAGNGLINVFPNPTAQMINVSIPETMAAPTYKLKVYNSSGNVVLQQTSTTKYWTQSVGHLQTGVYIVQVDKSDGTTLGKVKFVKQ